MALTHLTGLFVDPTLQPTPERTGSATFKVTGTTIISGAVQATASGKTTTLGVLSVTGKSTLEQLVVTSAANAMSGIRNVLTAGTGKYSIATNKVRSSSRIFLQPMTQGGTVRPKLSNVNTIASGVSFSIRQLRGNAGTAGVSGPVAWAIVQIV